MIPHIRKFTLLLIVAVSFNACVSFQVNPISGKKRVYGYSWEQEKQLGAESDKEIVAQYGLYDDPEIAEYVSSLGQELLSVSHLKRDDTPSEYKDIEFTFRVLDSPVVNAFALPGGFVYITRGLLGHLENEAQLMVVLGHEIGHVAARHASQRAAEQQFGQLAVIGGAVLGESFGLDGGNILQLSSQTAQLLFLSYSRDDERESDALGVEYSAMKGYKAAEGGMFFTSLKRISEKAGGGIPSHLSSHPDPGEREKTIPKLASEWEQKGYKQTKVDKDEFLKITDGILYGENPRNGFEKNGVFYHPDLKFKFPVPSGFALYNEPSAVILVNEAQDAVVQFTIDQENTTPKSSIEAILNQESISAISQEQITVSGYSGYKAEASVVTEDGGSLHLDISALNYNGNVYQFLSYTSEAQFNEYKSRFSSVYNGFGSVTDQSILNIKPVSLKLIKASKTAKFQELLPSSLPMNIEALDIAIINQVELDQVINKGDWIKIPVQ